MGAASLVRALVLLALGLLRGEETPKNETRAQKLQTDGAFKLLKGLSSSRFCIKWLSLVHRGRHLQA